MEDREESYSLIEKEFNDAKERATEMFNSHPQKGMIAYQYRSRRFLINDEFCEKLIECDWKRFYETSEFANSTSYLSKVLTKAIQDSPDYVYKILKNNPELIDNFVQLIPMVTTSKMRLKYIDYMIEELKDEAFEISERSWTNVFNTMVVSGFRAFDEIGTLYLNSVINTNNASPRTKIDLLEKWINTYGDRIGATVNIAFETAFSNEKRKLGIQYSSDTNNYKHVKERLNEYLYEINNWVQSMTVEGIEMSSERYKDNNEKLLKYDSETFAAIYRTLDADDLFIALNGDQIQFESDFYILLNVESIFEEVTSHLDKAEVSSYMNSLSYKLSRNGLKKQGKMILSIDRQYPYVSKEYLDMVAYCSESDTVVSVYGPERVFIYLIDRNLYTKEIKDLREFCKILYNQTTEYFSELLNDF